MTALFVAPRSALESPLGRTSPLAKLGVAVLWLAGLVLAVDIRPPLVLASVALLAGALAGGIPPRRLFLGVAPLGVAALGIGLSNVLFAGTDAGGGLAASYVLGPLRVTEAAVAGGIAIGARVLAIASVGVVFGLTTDSTRLADALVQQAHISPRFAYGALAAFQAVPRFAEDLQAIRQARRIRGLSASWHPRILVALLVHAIRHGDRLALAMDARAFGAAGRTTYRPTAWSRLDTAVIVAGTVAVVGALAAARV